MQAPALLEDAQRSGVRAAVVSNEFGELGIDQALLGSGDEAYVELAGGCVCCRLSDELVVTLQLLWERVRPERVIIETSGVALPFETQLNLWREPVSQWIDDDVTVVVVNAEQLAEGRDLEGTFEQQVSSADLLVLNQIDRVRDEALAGLEARIRELEPEAPLLRAVECDVDPVVLFPPDPDAERSRRRERGGSAPPHHHERFDTEELQVGAGLSPEALRETVLACRALRVKGFVETSEGLRLVQAVGPRVDLEAVTDPVPPGLLGRLVVIRRS